MIIYKIERILEWLRSLVSERSMACIRSDASFGRSICSRNDFQVTLDRMFRCFFHRLTSHVIYVGALFQFFETRSYIQCKSSSRATPDFPRENDNRHYQVLFHLHPCTICLWLR